MHALEWVSATNGLTGLASVALGLWVLSVRSREASNLVFAAYSGLFGLFILVHNLAIVADHESLFWISVEDVLYVLTGSALLGLVMLVPRRVARTDLAAGIGAVAVALVAAVLSRPQIAAFGFFVWAYWTALLFLALRWRSYATPAERSSAALVSSALVLWIAYFTGSAIVGRHLFFPIRLLPFVLAALWLVIAARGGGRTAVHVAWVTLAAMLAAMLETVLFPGAADLWGYSVVRLVGVAILAYAIVRHQLLGIDVKVRWGVSRSAVAAAFVAVFFVASALAQAFFRDVAGSEYIGILAAGALVFALAPLNRLADRVAAHAVPLTFPVDAREHDRPARIYERALRAAAADGAVTREEEEHLAYIASELGLSPVDALRVRRDVEREMGW